MKLPFRCDEDGHDACHGVHVQPLRLHKVVGVGALVGAADARILRCARGVCEDRVFVASVVPHFIRGAHTVSDLRLVVGIRVEGVKLEA